MKLRLRTRVLSATAVVGLVGVVLLPSSAQGFARPSLTYPKSNPACVALVKSNAYKPIAGVAVDKASTQVAAQGEMCTMTKGGSDKDGVPGVGLTIFPPAAVAALPGSTPLAKVKFIIKISQMPLKLTSTPSMGKYAYYGHGTLHKLQAQVVVWYQNGAVAMFLTQTPKVYPFKTTLKSIDSHFKA